jgi:hypothetical protein
MVYPGRGNRDRPRTGRLLEGCSTVLRSFRFPYNGAISYRLESITDDELVLVMSDGTRETWTRAPAE